MGVKNLWDILESCKKTLPLHHLQNKRVCIDLSCWMVQLQSVSKSHGGFKDKFYLKGLFHRLRALIALNCSLIFVADGSIPAIKLATYRKRLNSGHEISQDETISMKACSLQRNMGSEFSCMIKEAKMLGLALGVPCLDGIEEAEAQCALLNSESLCDGCFTSDSDIFLFGARTVYRDICLGEGGHVVCYEMADIEKILGFGRNSLIAWALLLGSDYSPGVTGFGPESTCRILKSVGEESILKKIVTEGSLFLKKTKNSKKKTQVPQCSKKLGTSDVDINFSGNDNDLRRQNQFLLVVDAYLKPKCHLPDSEKVYRVLSPHPFQHNSLRQLCSEFFGWLPEKTDEYILPKIAERDLQRFANLRLTSLAQGANVSLCKMPVKCPILEIVKRRKVQGKECFEVLWEGYDGLKTSVVSAHLVERACPERITELEEKIAEKKKPCQRRPRSKKSDNTSALSDIELKLQRILQDLDLETNLSSNPCMPLEASIADDRSTGTTVSINGRRCDFQNAELDITIDDCSDSTSCRDVDWRLGEYEFIDLVSPSPIKCQTISRLYKQPNGQQICVIDLSDSDVEMSPELTRKGRDLGVDKFQLD